MLFGHLALPTIFRHYLPTSDAELYIGSIFPDLLDKTLKAQHIAPNGRTISHTLTGLAVTTLLVHRVRGQQAAESWLLGYLGHLVCDTDSSIPWLWPLLPYDFPQPAYHEFWKSLWKGVLIRPELLELLLIGWAVSLIIGSRRPK